MKVNYHYGESDNGRLSADIKSLESKAFMAEVNQEKQSSDNIPADLNTSEQAELKSLKIAAEKLDRLLADKGVTEDELVKEFRQLRQEHNSK